MARLSNQALNGLRPGVTLPANPVFIRGLEASLHSLLSQGVLATLAALHQSGDY